MQPHPTPSQGTQAISSPVTALQALHVRASNRVERKSGQESILPPAFLPLVPKSWNCHGFGPSQILPVQLSSERSFNNFFLLLRVRASLIAQLVKNLPVGDLG